MYLNEELHSKWKPILEHEDLPEIKGVKQRSVTATLLENTEKALLESGYPVQKLLSEAPANVNPNQTTNVDNYDPVLISLVRRAMPNLIAFDIAGVQPMSGPTGLIFAMRSKYANTTALTDEAFYNEANTVHSAVAQGDDTTIGQANNNVGTEPSGNAATYNYSEAMTTAQAETNNTIASMGFTIEKVSVVARSRALKAEYTMELAQDLKAIHGLDAETELANILSSEILAEINREVVRVVNLTATPGAADNVAAPGTFDLDTDSNGRWMVEKFKGLLFQLEREANAIAKATRRGKGNLIICSSDVASALSLAGVLDYTPALNSNNLDVDDTGNTFAGVLSGRHRVYIDPYFASGSGNQYATCGYKGSSSFDAGLFYCPYVPLQMVRAVGEQDFQPKIGFKTRYGMVANPFSRGAVASDGSLVQNVNVYYRRFIIANLM